MDGEQVIRSVLTRTMPEVKAIHLDPDGQHIRLLLPNEEVGDLDWMRFRLDDRAKLLLRGEVTSER